MGGGAAAAIASLSQKEKAMSTLSESDPNLDPRHNIRQKKHKVQCGFYDIVNLSQNMASAPTRDDTSATKRINSTMALSAFKSDQITAANNLQGNEDKARLSLGLGKGAALSMKANNLKYHLMRDIL